MSGDLRSGGQGDEQALADEQLTDPAFLVTADPDEVMALTAVASRPAARLAAAVYRASAHAHGDADAAARRQILAVDAARFGDRELSDRIAAIEIPDVPAVRWRVEWASGSQVHPGFRGFLDSLRGGWPPPVVAVDGRPTTITLDDNTMSLMDPATGQELAKAALTTSARGEETTAVVDGRPLRVSCAGPDLLPRILDASTGELLGVLPGSGKSGSKIASVESVVIGGSPCVIAQDVWLTLVVWDLSTRKLIGELRTEGDDLSSWAVVTLDGRPHVVTGSYYGKVEVWDLATCERVGSEQGDDRDLQLMVPAMIGGRPHVLTAGRDRHVGQPLSTTGVWSVDPLQRIDRLPVGVNKVATATLGDRCYAFTNDSAVWELSPAAPVGNRTPGHSATVAAVATIVLDGRPVAVTGSHDETMRVWDLGTGRPVGPPLFADPDETNNEYDGVTGVRAAVVDGHPYVVAEHSDGYGPTVRVWDLATYAELTGDSWPTEISESMIDDIQLVPEETRLSVNGRTCAVTISPDPELERSAISFRDLDTGQEIDDTPFGPMSAFATGTVGGRVVAVVASGRRVRLWDSAGAPATVTDEFVFPGPVDTVAVTPEGRLVIGFGRDLAVLSRR